MRLIKRFILTLLFIFSFFSAFSQQIRQFSADTIAYIEEVRKFTHNYVSAEESKSVDRFISLWQGGTFTWEEMIAIAENSTKLLRKNGRPSPHFIKYFEILTIIYSPQFKDIGKDQWNKIFEYLLDEKSITAKTIDLFLKNSLNLLNNDELFNIPGNVWKGDNAIFRFDFKKGEPRVIFESFNLKCYSKRDSIIIYGTSGELDPVANKWYGLNGTINWERAGLDGAEVYAKLGNFQIDLTKSEYIADSVEFIYAKYLDYPIKGRLEDKVMLISDQTKAVYPKFFSYQNKFILPDLFKDIEYTGGISMQGSRLLGTGSIAEPAVLNILDGDTLRIKIESEQLIFSSNTVSSPGVKMTLYLGNDSIFHPDLQFTFTEKSNELRFVKSKTYTSAGPYINTYHMMDMNFEEFNWKRNERVIRFRPLTGTALGIAYFESNSFFNFKLFEDLQGRDNLNPLVALWQFSRMVNSQQFPTTNYARYLGMEAHQVRQQLMKLSRLGMIFFDDQADIIILLPKLFYFLDASAGKTDYDVIQFSSRTEAPLENALLDIDNFDLTINGIQQVFLSDSQNVVLMPYNNQIIMQKNKGFYFNGVVHAGLFSFYGNEFFFDYDNFKIQMGDIDSVGLSVITGKTDNLGRIMAEKINNLLEDTKGELLIDDPQNKSGLLDYPNYPIFNSKDYSYVYFDDPLIQNGVYSRDDVFFKADPFTMDSLDNFSQDGLKLTGEFFSNGILPPIEKALVLMPDNSLGFTYEIGDAGIPVYNGKGTLYQNIELSNKGLIGSGKLEYLASTTYSDNFLFHPDSLMTNSHEFIVKKQYEDTEFPDVTSKNNPIIWYIEKDQFEVLSADVPFTMFADSIKHNGKLLLNPKGLSGQGTTDMVSAVIASDEFNYKADQILSDSADFDLLSHNAGKLALTTNNVKARIDFKKQEGEFKSNEDYISVEFPENRFISKLDYFIWLIDEEQLHVGMDKPVVSSLHEDGLEGPRYISIHPKQDSLSFVSPIAMYDYNNFIIKATGVPYVQIADARIYPVDGLVIIEPDAVIKPLKEAKIVADYVSKYFTFFDATVTITGKNNYIASGFYNYFDETSKEQQIFFDQIKVDSGNYSTGSGVIAIIDSFKISPFFDFYGKVNFHSQSRLLTFDGATRLVHDCQVDKSWLKFKSEIDPYNVLIPITEAPVDPDMNGIFAGLMLTRDSAHVYSTFISGRKDYFDAYIASAYGFLTYDRENEYYEIAGMDKLADSTVTGNYLRFNPYPCHTYSEGKIDYLVKYNMLKMNAFGLADHDLEKDEFNSDAFLTFDFFFSQEALNSFASHIETVSGLKAYDITQTVYNIGLSELVGDNIAKSMSSELSLYGSYRTIPPEFKKTLILSNVKLKWNTVTRSFRYHGDAGIIRVGDNQINKQAEVYIELSKRSSGDLLDIYILLDEKSWYYFGYNPGSLQTISSNREYNDIIMNLKDKQRKLAVKSKEQSYIYSLAPDRRVQLFLRRYIDENEN